MKKTTMTALLGLIGVLSANAAMADNGHGRFYAYKKKAENFQSQLKAVDIVPVPVATAPTKVVKPVQVVQVKEYPIIKVNVRDLPRDSNGNVDFVKLTKERKEIANVQVQPKTVNSMPTSKKYVLNAQEMMAQIPIRSMAIEPPVSTPKVTPKVKNKTTIYAGVEKERKGKNKATVRVRNETTVMATKTFANAVRLTADAKYQRKTKIQQYDVNAVYKPTFVGKNGTTYALAGVGHEHSRVHKVKPRNNRSYGLVGAGVSRNLSDYQSVYLEGTFEKDFRNKKAEKIKKGTVELGFTTELPNKVGEMTVAAYHSQSKAKISRNRVRESGIRLGLSF